MGVEPERVLVDQVGLNHLTWIRAVYLDGRTCSATSWRAHGRGGGPVRSAAELIRGAGRIPSYYLRYFYTEDERLAEMRTEKPRAQEVAEIERELLGMYRDRSLTEKPALLERRGGAFYSEAATQLVAALASDSGDAQVVDVRNGGTVRGLAEDDVVEVPARIGATAPSRSAGAAGAGAARPGAARSRRTSGWQAEAAVSRDGEIAAKAMLAHPLVGQWPLSRRLLAKMEEAERA
jgi:6-phospho-beta-glucosidase